jgi:hypothetical protein
MPGLVPGIHVLRSLGSEDVDGRDEPGHDGGSMNLSPFLVIANAAKQSKSQGKTSRIALDRFVVLLLAMTA